MIYSNCEQKRCDSISKARAELLLKKAEVSIISEEMTALKNRYDLLYDYVAKLEEKLEHLKNEEQLNSELNFLKGQLSGR